eukprot:4018125-Pyramimonas_sp.AAC.1
MEAAGKDAFSPDGPGTGHIGTCLRSASNKLSALVRLNWVRWQIHGIGNGTLRETYSSSSQSRSLQGPSRGRIWKWPAPHRLPLSPPSPSFPLTPSPGEFKL